MSDLKPAIQKTFEYQFSKVKDLLFFLFRRPFWIRHFLFWNLDFNSLSVILKTFEYSSTQLNEIILEFVVRHFGSTILNFLFFDFRFVISGVQTLEYSLISGWEFFLTFRPPFWIPRFEFLNFDYSFVTSYSKIS